VGELIIILARIANQYKKNLNFKSIVRGVWSTLLIKKQRNKRQREPEALFVIMDK